MEQRHVWIPMEDGTRLAARLFLPDERPAPVVLDALPYRMDDLTASYASEYERLCEEGGFAVCRLDLRGTGSSEGIALDEYHPQEQADIREVIAWLAEQDWSTGRVGMYGTSWGGFNSIQVAMERPPALQAIVPIYASDDRYTDDVHYMGGVLKAIDLVDWVLYMAALQRPPAGAGRLRRGLARGVAPPDRRHGAVAPPLARGAGRRAVLAARIAAPAVRADHVPDDDRRGLGRRLHEHRASGVRGAPLPAPRAHRAVGHMSTGDLDPRAAHRPRARSSSAGSAAGSATSENGIDEEPPIAVFVRRSTRPAPDLAEMRGEWRSEPHVAGRAAAAADLASRGSRGTDRVVVRGDVGTAAWISCAGKPPWALPDDQREDDARSLTYDWGRSTTSSRCSATRSSGSR